MYHYVREPSPLWPRLKFLHVEDFRRQLDMFQATHYMIPKQEFLDVIAGKLEPPKKGIILTFDDGFIDHYQYVLPELVKRGLWGVFYLPSQPLGDQKKMLSVHCVHWLLARYPADEVLAVVLKMSTKFQGAVDPQLQKTYNDATTYEAQRGNTAAFSKVKRILNYHVQHGQNSFIESIFLHFFPACEHEKLHELTYMTAEQGKALEEAGNIVGSHSISHPVLRKLDVKEQQKEIFQSFNELERLGFQLEGKTFCFPYGSSLSYSEETLQQLKAANVSFCFDVDPMPITTKHVQERILNLPRYDCNAFMHGSAWDPIRPKTIAVFTSNSARHQHLIKALANVAEKVVAVIECSSVRRKARATATMQSYFESVWQAEEKVFGKIGILPENVQVLPIVSGDANSLDLDTYNDIFNAQEFFVFGASFLKGELCEKLVQLGAVNLHAGTSPYFRGCATNFWNFYDDRPDLTGVTVHYLTTGLDSGPILYHALPRAVPMTPHEAGMMAIRASHQSIVNHLMAGSLRSTLAKKQDKTKEIRYARGADFTEAEAKMFLERKNLSPNEVARALAKRDIENFVNPLVL